MSTFTFGFFNNSEETLKEDATVAEDTTRIAEQFGEAVVTVGTDLTGFGAATTKTVFKKGDLVRIDWERSTAHVVFVTRVGDGAEGDLAPHHVKLLQTDKDIETKSLYQSTVTPLVVHHDAIWNAANKVAKHPSLAMSPLVLEPGLHSFVWPLCTGEFVDTIYRKKVWVCHAATHRLESLREDFCNFNPYELIHNSSRVVVWMKDKKTGRMQYLDAPPDVATACYSAGHSLYFNPPVEVQRKYISELANDLGLDFGATLGSGDDDEFFGGDIEVFAVSGRHVTPWHWDAQENFTVQLTGTKRWSVRAEDIPHVLTNLHPRSSNQQGKRDDMKVHRSCTDKDITQPVEGYWGPDHGVYTFLLRPGSVMYLPSGVWHRVEAEDEEGSLSINFSMGGARWADFFQRRIATLLWKDPRWRERIHVQSPDAAREHLQGLLQTLPGMLKDLSPEDLLPNGIFGTTTEPKQVEIEGDTDRNSSTERSDAVSGAKRSRDANETETDRPGREKAIDAGYEQDSELKMDKNTRFVRSQITVLVVDNEWASVKKEDTKEVTATERNSSATFLAFIHSGFGSAGGEGTFQSDFSVTVRLPAVLRGVARYLSQIPAGGEIAAGDVLDKYRQGGPEVETVAQDGNLPEILVRMLRVLCHNGYLRVKQ